MPHKNPEDKKEYDRKRYLEKRKEKLEQAKKYYQTNKEKVIEYQKEYIEKNYDRIIERQKEYCKKEYLKNPEKFQIRNKKWKDANPEKVKAYEDSDRYKKQSKIASWKHHNIIADDWDLIHDVYMNTNNCDYCKKEFKNSLDRHLDHDHSLIDSNNIRGILCRECNTKDKLKGCPPIF